MNQTCEFGRFYCVIATGDVVRCVASKPIGLAYQFVVDENCHGGAELIRCSAVSLIPHMTSWDYDGPKHPEEGWRFVQPDERIELGDEAFSPHQRKWSRRPSLAGDFACECEWAVRRRIEPDHVAELDKVSWSPPSMEVHWHAVKAELLALREQNKRGDA